MNFEPKIIKEFAVLSFDKGSIRGCKFRRKKANFVPEYYTIQEYKTVDDSIAVWKKVFRQLGSGRECPLYLTGSLDNGLFFRFNSIELKPKMRRESLSFELSQHLPIVPDNCQFQFATEMKNSSDEVPVNVYAIPGVALENLVSTLSQVGAKIDEFIYPLLALNEDDIAVDISRLDENFGFEKGQWRPLKQDMAWEKWQENLSEYFQFPNDNSFSIKDYFECLLVGRLIVSSTFKAQGAGLTFLPKNLHPRRLRRQIHVAILLGVLLAVNYLWSGFGVWHENYNQHKSSVAVRNRLTNENNLLTRKIRAKEKEQRELAKLVAMRAGETDVIEKLAALSSKLPSDVLVSSLRWSESSLDLVLQGGSTNLNIPEIINQLPYWKISQLQQRRNGTSNTIILKLQVAGDDKK